MIASMRTYALRFLNHSLSSASLFASSINALAVSKTISILCLLAKRWRSILSSEVAVFKPPSCVRRCGHDIWVARVELTAAWLFLPSECLAMLGKLLSVRQEPFNGLLVIVVLLALNDDLRTKT